MKYSLTNLWSQEPAAIAEVVRQFLLVGVLILSLAGMSVNISPELILAVTSLVSIALTLFTRSTVYSPATVASMTDVPGADVPQGDG